MIVMVFFKAGGTKKITPPAPADAPAAPELCSGAPRCGCALIMALSRPAVAAHDDEIDRRPPSWVMQSTVSLGDHNFI
jgi:hypothetical protein